MEPVSEEGDGGSIIITNRSEGRENDMRNCGRRQTKGQEVPHTEVSG